MARDRHVNHGVCQEVRESGVYALDVECVLASKG